ncbi:hypothetical protein FJZ53_04600 [Candidatus Woesearchaeota archaeon]|nr:hypothetical protein [Candidatus Woesearchaeota archaeon]
MQLIERILGKKSNVQVLNHLVKHKDWQFNITELSKDTGINKGALSRVIEKLGKENVIKVSMKGKIKLFSINKENLFIKDAIIPLFEKESAFYYDTLSNLIKTTKGHAISIILYGSVASGKADLTSDIDILVIVSKISKALEEKVNKTKEEFLKNDLLLRVDLVTLNELKKIYKSQEPFILSVIKNHKVLYGKQLMEMVT